MKEFRLDAVLSVTTGISMCDSFGDVHEVFDHFYPGIMTIGVAMMSDRARERIFEQHPALRDIEVPSLNGARGDDAMAILRPWLAAMSEVYGETIALEADPKRQDPPEGLRL